MEVKIMTQCPECACLLCNYTSGDYHILVCWNCGYYESDSPAFFAYPELFRDIIRKNPQQFMRKFLKVKPSDEFLHKKKSDEDFTEPSAKSSISNSRASARSL
jgi:DNA-directed RNA polymerase subunit M/transcription elongation factor TFIIS